MLRALLIAVPLAFAAIPSAAPAQSGDAQVIVPGSLLSQTAPELHAVFEAIGLYEIVQIMSAEGIAAADQMEADMFPGQGGAAWRAVVAGIYSGDRLVADFENAVQVDAFTPEILAELTAFATSDLARRIAAGEVSARRAFLEPGVEDAANAMARTAAANDDPRVALLSEFIAVNDLVERNVSGALNANLAFFRGLSDGDAFEVEMPEELMLAEVWGQEPELRRDTTEWLFAYQITAYAELSDADLRAYIDLSESAAGRLLNTTLFQAFDVMFERISYDLGSAAAVFISGEET
jgi:hypothetical protein